MSDDQSAGNCFVVEGGRPISGTVAPAGNKNEALPVLAATLLCPGEILLSNVPCIRDVFTLLELLGELVGRLDIIVSFLALLEMTKFQLLRIHQSADGQLYVSPRYDSIDEAMRHIEDNLVDGEAQYAG